MSQHQTHESDRGAAFRGLILGAIAIGVLLFTIVRLTNSRYKSESPAKSAATTRSAVPAVALDV